MPRYKRAAKPGADSPARTVTTARSVALVLRYARAYRGSITVALTATVLLVAIGLAVPWIVRRLVSSVQESVGSSVPLEVVGWLAAGLLALYLVRALMRFAASYFAHNAGWGVVADARRDVYEHLQRLSMRFYEDQQTGQLMSRMVNDTDRFESLVAARPARHARQRAHPARRRGGDGRDELAPRPPHAGADPGAAAGRAPLHPAGHARLPHAAARARRAEREPPGQPLGHPRDQGLRPGGARGGAHRAEDPRLPTVADARPAPDGRLLAVRRVRLVARHGHRDLVRRPSRPRRRAARSPTSSPFSCTSRCSTAPCAP